MKDKIELSDDFLDVELSENQEKIEALNDKQKKIIENITEWLISKRNYKEYDIDAEFKVDKIIPLLKFIENDEVSFDDKGIIQKLRQPIEQLNTKGEVSNRITSLKYRVRYQAFELNNHTKGINISKDMNSYMDAQVAMLTGTARSIIGKLFDVDHSTTRLIQSLYFL